MEDNDITQDALLPNSAEIVRQVIHQVDETAPNVSTDEMWASLAKYNGWQKALKPYLLARIEALKAMMEIDFNGKETAEEIGIRYLICGGIAKEMQEIITKVETTKAVLDNIAREQATQ